MLRNEGRNELCEDGKKKGRWKVERKNKMEKEMRATRKIKKNNYNTGRKYWMNEGRKERRKEERRKDRMAERMNDTKERRKEGKTKGWRQKRQMEKWHYEEKIGWKKKGGVLTEGRTEPRRQVGLEDNNLQVKYLTTAGTISDEIQENRTGLFRRRTVGLRILLSVKKSWIWSWCLWSWSW